MSTHQTPCQTPARWIACLLALVANTAGADDLPAQSGPRQTVAVAPFGATSFFQTEYGQVDVGGGLAAMLTNALMESDSFIVVERAQLSGVLAEQELGAAGLAQGTDAARPGALIGARLRIAGEVTEFSEADKGKGLGLGLSLGSSRLSLAPQKRIGKVAIDVRVIDTLSSQVVAAFHVEESVESKATVLSVGHKGYSLGSENFEKTPLGQAARKVIGAIVTQFVQVAAAHPWSGAVVDVEGDQISINAGAASGIKIGDRFEIRRVAKVLTDPVTGRVLGQRELTVGQMIVSHVDAELAYGQFLPLAGYAPGRGDVALASL